MSGTSGGAMPAARWLLTSAELRYHRPVAGRVTPNPYAVTPMLTPTRAEIHLWFALCDQSTEPALLDRYRNLMSESERSQELRLRTDTLRRRFLVTRALVRTVLSRYVALEPDRWRFLSDKFGRPRILNEEAHAGAISFNIAHTDHAVMLGITSESSLGVDIESVGNLPRPTGTSTRITVLQLAERYFSAAESDSLAGLEATEQLTRFCILWTLKEAYAKARGQGLTIPLRLFSFVVDDARIGLHMDDELDDDPARWRFWLLQPFAAPAHASSREEPSFPQFAAVCAQAFGATPQRLVTRRVVPLVSEEVLPTAEIARTE